MDIEAVQLLRNIELHTKIISYALLIWIFIKVIGAISTLGIRWKESRKNVFNDFIREAIDEADYEYAISECNKMLKKKPNHEDANWNLARAYYYDEKYSLAKAQFEKVQHIVPSWKKHAKQYLKKINEKLEQNIK